MMNERMHRHMDEGGRRIDWNRKREEQEQYLEGCSDHSDQRW